MSVENKGEQDNSKAVEGEVINGFPDDELAYLIAQLHGVPVEAVQTALNEDGEIVNFSANQEGKVTIDVQCKKDSDTLIQRVIKFFSKT